jgi:hypothetical protein
MREALKLAVTLSMAVKDELVPMRGSAGYSRCPEAKKLCAGMVVCHGARRMINLKNEIP